MKVSLLFGLHNSLGLDVHTIQELTKIPVLGLANLLDLSSYNNRSSSNKRSKMTLFK
jgi:hypothetical protein